MPYIADLYHDTEYDMCRESDRMQRPKSQEQTELISLDGREPDVEKQMEILQKRLKDQKRERMII